jgi:chemotaxis signal transduction protein
MGEAREPHSSRYLVLRLAGREYAIHACRVQGMMQARGLQLKPISGSPTRPWAARVAGRDLPVVQPHGVLRLRASPVSARSCLVLIGDSEDGLEFALLADSISRLERVAAHCMRPVEGGEFTLAQIRLGEKWRDVLDVDKLAAA